MKELDDDLGSRASVLAPDMKNEDGGDEDERHDEHGNGSAGFNNLHRCSVLSRQKNTEIDHLMVLTERTVQDGTFFNRKILY